jgi:pyruvate/2-oxoglutarate/acetoin dehydrogenase E1 component
MSTVLDRLNHALHQALEADERVYILGEDILDPYGGAFKVSRGLSTKYPDRVLTTPISEAAIVGLASGMALKGLLPIVEIMFGDFVTLAADQLVNHAAKFRWMYNDQVRVPLVVRTPMGGRRGYGPTHSQSLEKMFMGIPGLKVVAPNTLGDPA